jgi:transposase
MNYVGIDWAYGRAAWCAMSEGGAIAAEGLIAANEDGLARLVLELGSEVSGCVEMMSGAVWVRDRLADAGWEMKVAHARKVRDVAPLACKTDKVDARVLAELCRRALVPELWLPSASDRALGERLRRRAHLVKVRTAARNRIFGRLTQFGLRVSHPRLRRPDAIELLEHRGVPEVWRASIAELLELAAEIDRRIEPIDRELTPLARADERARLLRTMPGIGPLLGLTFAAEIGEVARFRSPGKLVAYAGPGAEGKPVGRALSDRRPLQGVLEDAALGGGRGGQPGLAARQPLARPLPAGERAARQEPGEVVGRPQAPDRRLAHAFPRRALQASPPRGGENTAPASSRCFLTARRSRMELSGRGSSQERSAPRAPKRNEHTSTTSWERHEHTDHRRTFTPLTAGFSSKTKERFSSQLSLLARSGSGPSAAVRSSFSSNSSSGSPASALASIIALTLSYCNRYLQLSQYERRRRSNAFGFLA